MAESRGDGKQPARRKQRRKERGTAIFVVDQSGPAADGFVSGGSLHDTNPRDGEPLSLTKKERKKQKKLKERADGKVGTLPSEVPEADASESSLVLDKAVRRLTKEERKRRKRLKKERLERGLGDLKPQEQPADACNEEQREPTKKRKTKRKKATSSALEGVVGESKPKTHEIDQAEWRGAEGSGDGPPLVNTMPSLEASLGTTTRPARHFSKAEAETLRRAAIAQAHKLEQDPADLSWLFFRTKVASGAWEAITEALPGRGRKAVRSAANRILRPADQDALGTEIFCWKESRARRDVKVGRFSKKEIGILRQAIIDFAESRGLSTTDFSWLWETGLAKRKLNVWPTVGRALPHRNLQSIQKHGKKLMHPWHLKGQWKRESEQELLMLVEQRGREWQSISKEMKRTPHACRDKWREIRNGIKTRGPWSEEECERLQEAVTAFLRAREEAEKTLAAATLSLDDVPNETDCEPGPQMKTVLDDIDWTYVSDAVGTRTRVQCLDKWYKHLAPSMIATGEWGIGDDRRLIRALLNDGARMEYEAAWATLVPGRSAKQAQRRWRLMLRRIPNCTELDFFEQLEYLAKTFTPDLWERYGSSKPGQEDRLRQPTIEAATGSAEGAIPVVTPAAPGVDFGRDRPELNHTRDAIITKAEAFVPEVQRMNRGKKRRRREKTGAEVAVHVGKFPLDQKALTKRKKRRKKGTPKSLSP